MGGKGGTQTSSTTSSVPKNVSQNYDYVSGLAKQVASQPLQQYGGPLLAGFTPDQNSAFQGINNAQNAYQPYFDQAQNLVNQSTQPLTPFSSSAVQQYENPYQQDVINATMGQLNQQNSIAQNGQLGKAIAGGAFGGDRAGIAAAQLAKDQQLNNASVLSGLNSQNYQQALGQFNTSNSQQLQQNQQGLQAAGVYGNLGNSAEQNQLSQSLAQLQAGNQQQQLQQQALQIPYQQFQQQQQYPFQTTQWLSSILTGANPGGGTSTTSSPSQDNTFSNIVGAGLGIAGLFKDGGRASLDNHYDAGGVAVSSYVPDDSYLSQGRGQYGPPPPPNAPTQQSSTDSTQGIAQLLGAIKKLTGGSQTFDGDYGHGWHQTADEAESAADKKMGGILWNQPAQQLIPSSGPATAQSQMPSSPNDFILWNQPARQLIPSMGYADGGKAKRTLTTSSPEVSWTGNDFSFPSDATLKLTDADLKKYGIPKNNKFADGGNVNPFGVPGAKEVQGFNPIVAGTPVYSFDPNSAKAAGVGISPPASTNPTQTQNVTATPNQLDLLGALSRTSSQGPTGPGGAGFDISNGITTDLLNSILNPKGKSSFDPVGQQWVDYNGDPYSGMKSGGVAHMADGGDPNDLSSLYNIETPEKSLAFLQNNGLSLPDFSQSYVPDLPDAGKAPAMQTNVPWAANSPAGQMPAPQGISSAPSGPGGPPIPSPTGTPSVGGEPSLEQKPDDSFLGKLSADPARIGLLRAGLGTLAGGSHYAAQNIGQGGLLALQGYAADKAAKLNAQQEAAKTYAELIKAKALSGGVGGNSPLAIAARSIQTNNPSMNSDEVILRAQNMLKDPAAYAALTGNKDIAGAVNQQAEDKANATNKGKNAQKNVMTAQDAVNKSDQISGNIDNAISMIRDIQKKHPDITGSTTLTKYAQKLEQVNPAQKKELDDAIAQINAYSANNLLLSIKPYLQGTGQVRAFEGKNLADVFSYDPNISMDANVSKFEVGKQGIKDARSNALKNYEAERSGNLQTDSNDSSASSSAGPEEGSVKYNAAGDKATYQDGKWVVTPKGG